MKFAKELVTHMTPEWRKQYLNYKKLKEMLSEHAETLPDRDNTEETALHRINTVFKVPIGIYVTVE